MAIRGTLCTEKGISSLGDMYFRAVNNMALCKTRTRPRGISDGGGVTRGFQEAFVRCVSERDQTRRTFL